MIIKRERYIKRLKDAIQDPKVKCIVLDGPRHAGKTTLLKEIYHDESIEQKKYYFAFDDQISTKQFKDSQEFISFMQIRFGIDFSLPNLLFLNEIQYSKNIGSIIHDLINVHKIRTKIVATGITQGDYKEFLGLREKDFAVVNIHTLDFMEFLEFKGIHIEHLDPLKLSRILFDEIQPLLLEFLKRGGYPSVVAATTEEEKKEALKHIIQTVITKDVNFRFRKEEIHYFESILHIINDQHARIHNKRSIKKSHDIPATIINKYTRFLENHFLIVTLPHFFSDKTKEVSHKKRSVIMDMGIKNYLNDTFSVSIHDPKIMSYMTLQEIEKNMNSEQRLSTYKKINGSEIDFLISDSKKHIPVVIGDKNTDSTPKVLAGFEELYGKNTPEYIKTSLSISSINYLEGKPVYVMPYFLIGKYLQMQKKNNL